jgi:hypothetical protein
VALTDEEAGGVAALIAIEAIEVTRQKTAIHIVLVILDPKAPASRLGWELIFETKFGRLDGFRMRIWNVLRGRMVSDAVPFRSVHHLLLGLRVGLDVPLRSTEVCVSSQQLNVPERSPTVGIFRAVFVMNVRLPLRLEQS